MNAIVNFHRVTSSEWVDRMVNLLKSRFRLVDVESVYRHCLGETTLRNCCHITTDDGDRSFYRHIFPVLKRHRVPASLYLSPKICREQSNFWFQEVEGYDEAVLKGIVSDVSGFPLPLVTRYRTASVLKMLPVRLIFEIIRKYQSATGTAVKSFQNIPVAELLEIDRSGLVTIGAHTLNHPVLGNEDDSGSRYEIEASLSGLSDMLGRQVLYFAYPNGLPGLDFSRREQAFLKESGARLAFSTQTGAMGAQVEALSVPRVGVSDGEQLSFTRLKLYAAYLCSSYSVWKPHSEYRERMELRRALSMR